MKKIGLTLLTMGMVFSHCLAQKPGTIKIPDILEYKTLKGDFHMHTVFSDGKVWPTIRVEEAWLEGLDAISITEHIEYRPYKSDVPGGHNRAYEIAKPRAEALDILLIKASEVTRSMPPGHLNALFLEDSEALETKEWQDALKAARDQGAFIFWDHPGWARQQPDTTLWWDEHTWLLENDLLHGIEVVNGPDYYYEGHQFALEHGLTFMANTDVHNPIGMDYDVRAGDLRPMTLIFSKDRSIEGIKEAFFEGRTAALFQGNVAGKEEWLAPLFRACLEVVSVERKDNSFTVKVKNQSDIPLHLSKKAGRNPGLAFFRDLRLLPGHENTFTVNVEEGEAAPTLTLALMVENFWNEPGSGMPITLEFSPD